MRFPAQIQRLAFSVQRLVFVVILLTTYYLLLTTSAFAQAPNPYATPNTNPDVPQNLHTWTQNVMIEVMAAATCQIAGVDPINPNQKCLGVDPKTNSIGFVPSAGSGQAGGGGAIGLMGNLIALTYTPPLHTGDYFSYLAQNFGIAKPAYAQGTGFDGLQPLMKLWIAFRNIVYLLFVLVFVVIGVAIMLRVKIDPRTVMTIENQIPKIIVGLLLVTFSFAIAGFLIDLMYLGIYLIINIISGVDPTINNNLTKIAQSTHPWDAANMIGGAGGKNGGFLNLIGPPAATMGEFLRPVGEHPIGRVLSAIGMGALGKMLGEELPKLITSLAGFLPGAGTVTGFITSKLFDIVAAKAFSNVFAIIFGAIGAGFAPQILTFLGGVIAFIVITIALLFALFRLWFELLKAYIFILIDVVLAPFFIVLGLFPGSPISFGAWMRDILANLSAFPVTIAMFLLGRVFMSAFGRNEPNQFTPPLIGNPADTSAFGALIGLGIILITPQVVNMMKEMLKAPKLDVSAIGKGIGVGAGAGKGIIASTTIGAFGTTKMGEKGISAVLRRFIGI